MIKKKKKEKREGENGKKQHSEIETLYGGSD